MSYTRTRHTDPHIPASSRSAESRCAQRDKNAGRCLPHEHRLIARYFEDLEAGRLDRVARLYAEDATRIHLNDGRRIDGREDILSHLADQTAALESISLCVERVVADGESCRDPGSRRFSVHWSGQGLDHTGKKIALRGIELVALDCRGRIQRQWLVMDHRLSESGPKSRCGCAARALEEERTAATRH